MDRLYCMQVFVRVVEQGAFTKAAEVLSISRASATEAVAQLERRLGVRLLNRTTRRVQVTQEGRSYYADCLRLLREIDEIESDLADTLHAPRGRLRISVPQSFVSAIFFPALTQFTCRYPDVEVELLMTDRAVNLLEEGVDCALRGVEVPANSGLVARLISVTHWLTAASPGYLERHGTPQSIEDLKQHNCIRFVSQTSGRQRDWNFNVDGVRTTFVPQGNLKLTSYDAAIQLALSGTGVVQIPDVLGFAAVSSGQLRPVLTQHLADAPSLMLVYPGNRYLPAKVRAFADFMSASFPREGWRSQIIAQGAASCGTVGGATLEH